MSAASTRGATLGGPNFVRGTGGRWRYGLRVRESDGSQTFTVYGPDGQSIEIGNASSYRTTSLARRMGDPREGYESRARRLIREVESSA